MSFKADEKEIRDGTGATNDDMESTTAKVIRGLKEKATGIQEKAVDFQHDAADYIKENYSKAKDKSLEISEKITDYARKNPLKTIGISVAVGAVLAKLFRSRK